MPDSKAPPAVARPPRVMLVAALALLLVFPAATRADAVDLAFKRHVINAESEFMAAAVFDVNHDGKLDIVCGGFWYEAPTWKPHFLRKVEMQANRPDGYAHQALDVNGDGWTDVITVNWRTRSVKWIEHPGADVAKDKEWVAHTIATPGSMESGRLVDLLGDGTPAILPSTVPFWWELKRSPNPAGGVTPEFIQHALPREVAGHGVGFGDINGDGRGDIIGHAGWLEAPEDRRGGQWTWHPDFELGQASVPTLVVDVNGDGLNDLVWCMAHDYGIYWLEQTRAPGGKRGWVRHAIDTSWAGSHAPLWVDLDGDGKKELVVGRRFRAHEGNDAGEFDPQAIYRYDYDAKTRTWKRFLISYNDDTCFGLDPVAIDLTGSGKTDLVFGGRHGLYWMENLGRGNSVAQHLTHDPLWFPAYDHNNLMVIKDEAGKETPVKDRFEAGIRRAHTIAAIQAVTGPLPESYQRVPLDMKVIEEKAADGYTRRKITYGADLHSRVTAYLLVPKGVTQGAAGVICLHDDTPLGKDEPAGLGGRESMQYAVELVKKGYVCLVPDYPGYGEDKFDLKTNTEVYSSGAMKAVWNNLRGLDLLEAIPEVASRRLGLVGHGLGGESALLTAALDNRVSATVASCGATTFAGYKGRDLADLADARRMPRIGEVYKNDPTKIPYDLAELLAAAAPHSVFVSAPLHDVDISAEAVKQAAASALPLFRAWNDAAGLRVVHPDGGRDFSAATRAEAFTWLDQRVGARNGRQRILQAAPGAE